MAEELLELVAKVVEIGVIDPGIAEFLEDGQEVAKGTDGRQGRLGLGSKEPSGDTEQECSVESLEGNPLLVELAGEETVIGAGMIWGMRKPAIELEHGADVGGFGGKTRGHGFIPWQGAWVVVFVVLSFRAHFREPDSWVLEGR